MEHGISLHDTDRLCSQELMHGQSLLSLFSSLVGSGTCVPATVQSSDCPA